MEVLYFPAVKLFVVPDSVALQDAGDYASAQAAKLITELGVSRVNPKSLLLRTIDARTYALHYNTNQQPSYAPSVDASRPNPGEPSAVAADTVADGYKEGPVGPWLTPERAIGASIGISKPRRR